MKPGASLAGHAPTLLTPSSMFIDSLEAGVLILDQSFKPLTISNQAIRILTFGKSLANQNKDFKVCLSESLRASLVDLRAGEQPKLKKELLSGRRRYFCHIFDVNHNLNCDSPRFVVLLERSSSPADALQECSSQFELTHRECEVVQLLIAGLTSKEIGARLDISPNTVKAFLRLVMVKMGVSTRAAIVGKVVRPILGTRRCQNCAFAGQNIVSNDPVKSTLAPAPKYSGN